MVIPLGGGRGKTKGVVFVCWGGRQELSKQEDQLKSISLPVILSL